MHDPQLYLRTDDETASNSDENGFTKQHFRASEGFLLPPRPDDIFEVNQFDLHSEATPDESYEDKHPEAHTTEHQTQYSSLKSGPQHDSESWKTLLQLSEWIEIPDFIPPRPQRHFLELFSGNNFPLSSFLLRKGIKTLRPFDILPDPKMDILNDDSYHFILRLIACKQVGSILAAPPCTEYSLLKLKQPGPLPCRSPDCMEHPLFDSEECKLRSFSSREMIERSVTILHVNHLHGGYSTMEQPLSAMSWEEPCVLEARKTFLTESAIISHCRVLTPGSEPLNKHWQFVSNIQEFHKAELQCTCSQKHQSFAGVIEADGNFASQRTAEYPLPLVQHLTPYLRLDPQDEAFTDFIEWESALKILPSRPPAKFGHIPDGAGLVSSALWPLPFKCDIFRSLRKKLEAIAIYYDLPRLIPKHIQAKTNAIPFDQKILDDTDLAFKEFFIQTGDLPTFDIVSGQPFRLSALQRLTQLMSDPDEKLIPLLQKGVDLGTDSIIPSSKTWPDKIHHEESTSNDTGFHIFEHNWHSAEADEQMLERLIQQEIDDGFVVEVGSLQDAQEKFGSNLAIGKLGIATQQPTKHRLVLDSTISGLNPLSQKAIQEKCSYPKLSDLQQCVPAATRRPCTFMNMDIKSTHKRIKVRPEQQGLLAFQFKNRVYHYQVLHFGGTCSAYYWTRLAAIFLRFFHQFLYVYHFGLVFVDDFIFGLDTVATPLQASTLLLCVVFLNIPLSWHKPELGYQITWIGWTLDSWSDTVQIPHEKLTKLIDNLDRVSQAGKFKRNDIEAVTGHLLWISEIFPFVRWTLGIFYSILARPGIQLVRLNKEQIQRVLSLLDSDGQLTQFLQRPYIPQGSILSSLGKIPFHSGKLQQFRDACFDLSSAWASLWNCRSNRVQIYDAEAQLIQALLSQIRDTIPRSILASHRRQLLQAGADAFATKDNFGLGAWLSLPHKDLWFSLLGDRTILPDFFECDSLQRHIISFETMAQCILLIMFSKTHLRGIDFLIQSKVDNQASEAIIAQGFTQIPIPRVLTQALQKLTFTTNIQLQPYRCSSEDNARADDLSRGNLLQECSENRCLIGFPELLAILFPL